MSRQDALDLLHEYTANENLRKHAYAVEADSAHPLPCVSIG